MASLAQRVSDGFSRVASEIKNTIRPRLIPPGGDKNYTLIKASSDPYNVGWAAPQTSHFVDVKGQGTTPYVTNGNNLWPRVPMNQVIVDVENCWDVTNNWYTVPETGLYLINGTFRPPDRNDRFSYDFGFGVHTEQADGGHFFWTFRSPALRYTAGYARMAWLNRGERLRMFIYTDYLTLEATVATAQMQIGMVSRSF